jgi:AcrR family transcriptional regulator
MIYQNIHFVRRAGVTIISGLPSTGAETSGTRTERSPRGERTRQRLIEVAIRQFAARGYKETSLSSIAREAGVTPAAVYAYADGKEALLHLAFDHDAEGLFALAVPPTADLPAQAPTGQASADHPWVGSIVRMIAVLPDHPLVHRVLRGLEPDLVPRLHARSAATRMRHVLERMLRDGQARGSVRTDIDPARLAVGLEVLLLSTLLATVQAEGGSVEGGAYEVRRDGMIALIRAALDPPA